MGVVNYFCIEGELISETRNGVESDYIPDTLGNTIKLVNMSGAVTDTFEYWPYGELRSHTGTSETPFTFGGTLGYYSDQWGGEYVRARELEPVRVSWMSMDPLWPAEQAFGYVRSNPISLIDPYGLQVCPPPVSAAPVAVGSAPVCVIGLGIVACWELYTYQPGKPTGPFTGIGQSIGNKLFPDPEGSSSGLRIQRYYNYKTKHWGWITLETGDDDCDAELGRNEKKCRKIPKWNEWRRRNCWHLANQIYADCVSTK
jgi:RHS repeat-associated protein